VKNLLGTRHFSIHFAIHIPFFPSFHASFFSFFLFCWNCRIEEAERCRQFFRPEVATFRQESGDKVAGRYVECRIPDGTIGRALGNSYLGKNIAI
jgi:hypothetical protein